jgi:hypothetical protein
LAYQKKDFAKAKRSSRSAKHCFGLIFFETKTSLKLQNKVLSEKNKNLC